MNLCVCVFRSLQDVQIWFQPNTGSSSDVFLPHSDSQDGLGKLSDLVARKSEVVKSLTHLSLFIVGWSNRVSVTR